MKWDFKNPALAKKKQQPMEGVETPEIPATPQRFLQEGLHYYQGGRLAMAKQSFEKALEDFLAQPSGGEDAAGLVLRWMDQLSRGQALSYRTDVAAWLQRHGDEAGRSGSASALGIMLAEGVIDRDEALARAGEFRSDTLELVAFLESVGESDRPGDEIDLAVLRSVARSPRTGAFAPRLARAVLDLREDAADR